MTTAARGRRDLEVVRAGALTTVQDLGRPGHAHLGVPRSGALDQPAHRLANRLVGNPAEAATLETTLTGCAVRLRRPVTRRGDRRALPGRGRRPPGGLGRGGAGAGRRGAGRGRRPPAGLRSYVAFGGGIDGRAGARQPLHRPAVRPRARPRSRTATCCRSARRTAPRPARRTWSRGAGRAPNWCCRVLLGPRDDWFTAAALRTLATGRVPRCPPHSNRIGLRTEGPALERARDGELPSEGMVLGAVQVPPDGRPVVFLADHPTTGGYPVVGVVPERPVPAAAARASPAPRVPAFVRPPGRQPAGLLRRPDEAPPRQRPAGW